MALINYKTMTEDDRNYISEMGGKIVLWSIEGRATADIAKDLKLHPYQVEYNIDEMIYILRKRVGLKRFLRTLFWR